MATANPKFVEKLVEYSPYLGKKMISTRGIRKQHEKDLVEKVINQSIQKVQEVKSNSIEKPSFFTGSVDFMVHEEDGEKKFAIVETNGGSGRGISAIQKSGWELIYDGLLETLKFAGEDPLVLIGHPDDDKLLYEKFLLAENFRKEKKLELLNKGKIKKSGVFLGPYKQIIPKIEIKGDTPYLEDRKVDVMIGDGIVRRKEGLEKKGKKGSLNTVLANEVFPETDDKSLTYKAVKIASEELKKFRIHPLDYWRAHTREELVDICRERIEKGEEVVVKPYGGSGGSGIDLISSEEEIDRKLKGSYEHFHFKFGEDRNPFPYTVCEKINFRPIKWKSERRNFDIRIYVTRKGDEIVPCGGLARVALEPYTKEQRKESFVVNLTGYEGVDINRGRGMSKKALNTLELTEEDFVDMFSASVLLFKNIVENHEEVTKSAY